MKRRRHRRTDTSAPHPDAITESDRPAPGPAADGAAPGAPPVASSVPMGPVALSVPVGPVAPVALSVPVGPVAPVASSVPVAPVGFWERVEQVRVEAELLAVPSVATTAVIGPLDRIAPIVRRCRRRQWGGDGEVFVLTDRTELVDPGWQAVGSEIDLVAIAEDDQPSFPVLVIDVPRELPSWVGPLVVRLRAAGLGLVRYGLVGDPTDEDLATWHGVVGRPSVLDLVSPIGPTRVLGLLERGEPVASIAGWPLGPELMLALRLERDRERIGPTGPVAVGGAAQ